MSPWTLWRPSRTPTPAKKGRTFMRLVCDRSDTHAPHARARARTTHGGSSVPHLGRRTRHEGSCGISSTTITTAAAPRRPENPGGIVAVGWRSQRVGVCLPDEAMGVVLRDLDAEQEGFTTLQWFQSRWHRPQDVLVYRGPYKPPTLGFVPSTLRSL